MLLISEYSFQHGRDINIYIYSKKFYYVVRNYTNWNTTIRHPRKIQQRISRASVHTDTNINAPTGATR
jgi:hypothetical protein